MNAGPLGEIVRAYLERVVNQRDVTAVGDFVAPDYRGLGQGWPVDVDALRDFYVRQAASRPDWRIEVQETMEVADVVVVRACAGGCVFHDAGGERLAKPCRKDVEWLASYRILEGRIREIALLAVRDR